MAAISAANLLPAVGEDAAEAHATREASKLMRRLQTAAQRA
jgi:hypothetical protein